MGGDGDGVLGNLPRSRPGRRSEKREGGSRGRPAAARDEGGAPVVEPRSEASGQDAVGDAVRAAAKAAEAGLRVASELTREVLRRLPRP